MLGYVPTTVDSLGIDEILQAAIQEVEHDISDRTGVVAKRKIVLTLEFAPRPDLIGEAGFVVHVAPSVVVKVPPRVADGKRARCGRAGLVIDDMGTRKNDMTRDMLADSDRA